VVGAGKTGSGSFSAGILPASEVPTASCASMRPAVSKSAATGFPGTRPILYDFDVALRG